METKTKIFIGLGAVAVLGIAAYATKSMWMGGGDIIPTLGDTGTVTGADFAKKQKAIDDAAIAASILIGSKPSSPEIVKIAKALGIKLNDKGQVDLNSATAAQLAAYQSEVAKIGHTTSGSGRGFDGSFTEITNNKLSKI